MSTELLRYDELTASDLERWKHLISAQAGYESPFFHPHFTRTVSSVRSDIHVLVHSENNPTNVFWPLQISGRTAFPAGAPFSDYHGPVLEDNWRGNPVELLKKVGLTGYKFTSLFDPRHRFASFASGVDGTFVCNISEGADAFFETQKSLFPRHTKKMRRLSRKVEREVGAIQFEFDDRDERAFEQVLDWKSQQYRETGRHDVLAPVWVRAMLKTLWQSDIAGCRGCFHTLRQGDRLIAGEFNLLSKSTIHGWIPSFDHEFWSYSPGYLLQDEIIRHASQLGFRDYDLGVSAGHYKKYYANFQIPVIAGSIRTPGLGSGIGAIGENAWLSVESAGIPKLSEMAGRIRRRYAMIRTVETTAADRLKGVTNAASLLFRRDAAKSEDIVEATD